MFMLNPSLDLLFKCLDLIVAIKLWPDKSPSNILKILMYVHSKGWLYTPTVDGELTAVMCGYRIPEVNEENLTKMPLKEEGNILYIPFVVSMKKDLNLFQVIRESCKIYLEKNPDITEIVVEDKNNKIKRYKLNSLAEV
jgi:hypothetical protein